MEVASLEVKDMNKGDNTELTYEAVQNNGSTITSKSIG